MILYVRKELPKICIHLFGSNGKEDKKLNQLLKFCIILLKFCTYYDCIGTKLGKPQFAGL